MYKSPIDLIMTQMNMALDNEICEAIQKVGVYVDKEELLRALQYDRRQYQKGYDDRDAEIVRCEDCKKRYTRFCPDVDSPTRVDDWFCADGERRTDDA